MKWLNLLPVVFMVTVLAVAWLGVALPTALPNSTYGRMSANPARYMPVLVMIVPPLLLAVWPGSLQVHRCLVAAGWFVGLGLAIMWFLDGGFGGMVLASGAGMLSFGRTSELARRIGTAPQAGS